MENRILKDFQSEKYSLEKTVFFSGNTRKKDSVLTVFYGNLDERLAYFDLCHELGHILTTNGSQLNQDDAFGFERFNPSAISIVMETEANAISSQFVLIKEYFEQDISFDEFWEFERTKFLDLIYSNLNSGSMERKERLAFKSTFEKNILLLIKSKIEQLDLNIINEMFKSQMSKIEIH